ncbi:MAG: hypothetical protein ACPGPC_17530 [Alphaproteobacteria bacterium]
MLYLIYARPWFRDYVHYDFDQALRITRKEFNKVHPKYQHLFDWLMVKPRKKEVAAIRLMPPLTKPSVDG